MTTASLLPTPTDLAAEQIRQELRRSRVFAVELAGPPRSGKTTIMQSTLAALSDRIHTAAVLAHPDARRDESLLSLYCDNVVAAESAAPDALRVRQSLQSIHLPAVDLLLVETLGGMDGAPALGQDATVAVMSVGFNDVQQYRQLLVQSQLVLLTQTDLMLYFDFNAEAFERELHHINPLAQIIQMSAIDGYGMDRWLSWLGQHLRAKVAAAPPPESAASEWFFG